MTANWFCLNLGDAIIATPKLQQIKREVEQVYKDNINHIAVFWRQYSEAGMHCDVNVYFSPKLDEIAIEMNASRCHRPVDQGLNLLAGNASLCN